VALANDSLGNIRLAGGPKVFRWQTSSADTYVAAGLDLAEIFNGVSPDSNYRLGCSLHKWSLMAG
jgi:hypothetical protein